MARRAGCHSPHAPTSPEPKQYGGEVTEADILGHGQLIVRIARQIRKYSPYPVDLRDLVQTGWTGFLSGLKRYDPTRGITVGAYCTVWVRGAIHRSVFKKRAVWEAAIFYGDLKESKLDPNNPDADPSDNEPSEPEQENARLLIHDLLALLPERDRNVLSDLWFRNLTKSQIARNRNMLIGDVIQISEDAIRFLREATEEA